MAWKYFISDPNSEEIVWTFCEKELQKTNQKEFRVDKVVKRKATKLYVNLKAMIVLLIVELIKKGIV